MIALLHDSCQKKDMELALLRDSCHEKDMEIALKDAEIALLYENSQKKDDEIALLRRLVENGLELSYPSNPSLHSPTAHSG